MSSEQQKPPSPPPGTYTATLVGGAFHQGKNGMQVGIQFQLKNRVERLWWVGYLYGGAMKTALKTLAITGFNEGKDVTDENGKFDSSYFLNPAKELDLVIDHETYEGKTRARIQWVNEPGGGKFGNVKPAELKVALEGLNLRAEIAAARASLGMLPSQADTTPPPPPGIDPNEQTPF